MCKLILAEKPSAAQSIAAVLDANERGGGFLMVCGYIRNTPIFMWPVTPASMRR